MPDFHQFLRTPEMASRSGFLAITGDIAELAGQRVHFFDHEPLAAVKHIRGRSSEVPRFGEGEFCDLGACSPRHNLSTAHAFPEFE